MNHVDATAIGLISGATTAGLILGLFARVRRCLAVVFGGGVGIVLAPIAAPLGGQAVSRAEVELAVVLGSVLLGLVVSAVLWPARAINPVHWSSVLASGTGAFVGSGAALFATLLTIGVLAEVGWGPTAPWQSSPVVHVLDGHLPFASSLVHRLEAPLQAIRSHPSPPGTISDHESMPSVRSMGPDGQPAALRAERAATVLVTGPACGEEISGSGIVIVPDLVLTNAHVIAGDPNPVVEDPAGRHPAVPVLFDPQADLAVLRTRGLLEPPLRLLAGTVPPGTSGLVMGYPYGGPLQIGAMTVVSHNEATGRNIYGRSSITRDVYVLRAVVRPGDSGGPVIGSGGTVIGVVFAYVPGSPDQGFALTSADVLRVLGQLRPDSQPVSDGQCIQLDTSPLELTPASP